MQQSLHMSTLLQVFYKQQPFLLLLPFCSLLVLYLQAYFIVNKKKTMDVTESEMGEAESTLQSDQQAKNSNDHFSSLGRQPSIYSLTLDEFQHTLCESGKDFGSMNMDEFLTSIWTAEENQANSANNNNHQHNNNSNNHIGKASQGFNDAQHRGSIICKQPSLPRQGSLTLPAPLCRKTVDEVWSEIHMEQHQIDGGGGGSNSSCNVGSAETPPRQRTFGEMTLEDFLIKAGVVREQCTVPPPPHQQQCGLYQNNNNNPAVGAGFVSRPISIAAAGGGGCDGGVSYQSIPHGTGGTGESSGRNGGYQPRPTAAPAAVYGGRVGNGGGYGPGQGMGVVGPVSPVSSDGMVTSVDNAGNQYGMDISGLRGRKRIIDRPVEKGVERRQRRMIKNRESAARSRARKQAYTVELEAELNQLKEENKQLKLALAELDRKRKQQYLEELRMKTQTKAQKAKEKLRLMRRNLSCHL